MCLMSHDGCYLSVCEVSPPVKRPGMAGSDREVATKLPGPFGLECLPGLEVLTCNVCCSLPCVQTITNLFLL
jgi:hypothetical protein